MFTSTSPLLLFRPTEIRDWRIKYSKSLPSNLAIAIPFGSGFHLFLAGLVGADWFLRANNARASLSEGCCNADITRRRWAHQNGSTRKKTIDHVQCCLHTKHSQHALLTTFSRDKGQRTVERSYKQTGLNKKIFIYALYNLNYDPYTY